MLDVKEIKRNLLASFEIYLFMPRGVERFEVTPEKAIRSFLIPITLMPLAIIAMIHFSGVQFYTAFVAINIVKMFLAMGLFFTAVYFLTKHFERHQYFYRFVMISNWLNILGLVLLLPIFVGIFMGIPQKDMESYAIFSSLLGYVYSAFVLTHCFRLPWELGGFMAIVGLAIDDNLFKLAGFLYDKIA